jgi:hypothetical protein
VNGNITAVVVITKQTETVGCSDNLSHLHDFMVALCMYPVSYKKQISVSVS